MKLKLWRDKKLNYTVASDQTTNIAFDKYSLIGIFIHAENRPSSSLTYRFHILPYLYAALKYTNFEATYEGNRFDAHIRGNKVVIEESQSYQPGGPTYTLWVWELIRILHYWDLFNRGELGDEFILTEDTDINFKQDEKGRWLEKGHREPWVRTEDDELWAETTERIQYLEPSDTDS